MMCGSDRGEGEKLEQYMQRRKKMKKKEKKKGERAHMRRANLVLLYLEIHMQWRKKSEKKKRRKPCTEEQTQHFKKVLPLGSPKFVIFVIF